MSGVWRGQAIDPIGTQRSWDHGARVRTIMMRKVERLAADAERAIHSGSERVQSGMYANRYLSVSTRFFGAVGPAPRVACQLSASPSCGNWDLREVVGAPNVYQQKR